MIVMKLRRTQMPARNLSDDIVWGSEPRTGIEIY